MFSKTVNNDPEQEAKKKSRVYSFQYKFDPNRRFKCSVNGNPPNLDLLWPIYQMNQLKTSIQSTRTLAAFVFSALVFFQMHSFSARAQSPITEDRILADSMKKAVEHLYNFQFEKSESCLKRYRPKYNNHPGFLLYGALTTYFKHFPVSANSKIYQAFINTLNQVVALGEKMSHKYPKSPEPDYYQMTANLMLAKHHSEEGEYIKAVNETRKAFVFIKRGFEYQKSYPDFYLATGLYNYFRVVYPENHPIYKPFTIFFPDGNKSVGLKELELAAQKSLFSKAEALMFLSLIHLREEYNPTASAKYSVQLFENYPNNWLFQMLHAEVLIETKKMDQAEPLVSTLLMRTETLALLAGYYMKGLQEVANNKPDAAKWAFHKALSISSKNKDKLSLGYKGLAYNELGKIAYAEGKRDWVKKYFKQALDLAAFKKIRQDSKRCGY